MLTLYIDVPYASFRKSYARSFAETYSLPPPATVYGMLLSLVGERLRRRHAGVRLAFAYKCRGENGSCADNCLPYVATTVRKLSRFKYGVSSRQKLALGHKPDFIETLCGIKFLCFVDSLEERGKQEDEAVNLEERLTEALLESASVERSGVLCLGLSDDLVNDVRLFTTIQGGWHRLVPRETGMIELPVWVDHTGSAWTRWQRYEFESSPSSLKPLPGSSDWPWTQIKDPRINEKSQ